MQEQQQHQNLRYQRMQSLAINLCRPAVQV